MDLFLHAIYFRAETQTKPIVGEVLTFTSVGGMENQGFLKQKLVKELKGK